MGLAGFLGEDLRNFVAGLLGRMCEVFTSHPFKTLRSRQQQGTPMFEGAVTIGTILGLWRGVSTQVTADCIKVGLRFLITERIRTFLQWLLIGRRQSKKKALADAA